MKEVKVTYAKPTLRSHGTIDDVTRAQTTGTVLDSDQQAGNPPLLS